MRKKLAGSAGFTLVETLCAVVVLALLCLMLNSGLSVAVKAYHDMTVEAETQLLLNSVTNAIAGELRYAHQVDGTDNPTYNDGCQIQLINGQVYVKEGRELLPKEKNGGGGAYKNGEYKVSTIDGAPLVSYADGFFTVKLKVTNEANSISAETPEDGVVIRCLNPPKEA